MTKSLAERALMIALLRIKEGKVDEGLRILKRIEGKLSDSAQYWTARALAEYVAGDKSYAIEAARKAARLGEGTVYGELAEKMLENMQKQSN